MKNLVKLVIWLFFRSLGVGGCLLGAGAAWAVPVPYRDYDANARTFTNAVRECTLVTSETRVLEDGWYAVAVATTNKIENGLDISGTAHLILCDGALLEVGQPAENRPGIRNEGTTLAIYGQAKGSGTLEVKGGSVGVGEIEGSAGIGGGPGCAGGTVIINGGRVMVTSDSGGAAIGWYWRRSRLRWWHGDDQRRHGGGD